MSADCNLNGTDVTYPALADIVFAKQSHSQEWRERGDMFLKRKLYHLSAKCYAKSGDAINEKESLAYQRAVDAARLKHNDPRRRDEFLFAAEDFLECRRASETAACLNNAREFSLAAQMYEKMGKVN